METTFITIHDLTPEARVLYSSDSIVDILGHTPDEVVGRSTWEFFHPNELPLAKEIHKKGVTLDKAAVLAYCQIRNRQGQWVGCECCFTIVYDVMVVCTSIYRRGLNSQKRAVEAPIVRRLFSSSPKDPRYHMLSHLSSKFKLGPDDQTHEPRAALFLNRFTRTLTIMYATSGIEDIIGISGEGMKGRSFYYCIQENCLEDAVRCLEGAKGNDSIAYLRFWFRDPRQDDVPDTDEEDTDESMTDVTSSDNEEEDESPHTSGTGSSSNQQTSEGESSGASASRPLHEALLGPRHASDSANSTSPSLSSVSSEGPVELEAVVSCTSDGLVVILRRARPIQPPTYQPAPPAQQQPYGYANGLFAAPWAPDPMFLPQQPQFMPVPQFPPARQLPNFNLPALHQQPAIQQGPPNPFARSYEDPIREAFMRSIRDVAVFAWALTGINGSLEQYSRGKPLGESQPPDGFPIWDGTGADGISPSERSTNSSNVGRLMTNGPSKGHLVNGMVDERRDSGMKRDRDAYES